MNINSHLREIARDVYKRYYSKPYPSGKPRIHHGMDHVSRASVYGALVYKLMCFSGDEGTGDLTEEAKEQELKLIQIALLLHDSAREADGFDEWDRDSGINIYVYLTETLGVKQARAKMVAEMMTNKDWKLGQPYYELVIPTLNDQKKIHFQENKRKHEIPKDQERIRLAIQHGDCVDIFRVKAKQFNWDYLDYYNKSSTNANVKKVIEHLMPECFDLTYSATEVQDEDAYDVIIQTLLQYPNLKMLHDMSMKGGQDFQILATSNDIIIDAFIEQNLFFRGMTKINEQFVRDQRRKNKTYPSGHSYAVQEFKKMSRRGEETAKVGNPARSYSLLGQGGKIFSSVGGGLLLSKAKVLAAYTSNQKTGFGPKHQHRNTPQGHNVDQGLSDTRRKMRTGKGIEGHPEAIVNATVWDCIMYSEDIGGKDRRLISMRYLQAIFLRDVYHQYYNVRLPIYFFSQMIGFCREADVSDQRIIDAYENQLYSFTLSHWARDKSLKSYEESKQFSADKWIQTISGDHDATRLDCYYDVALKTALHERLNSVHEEFHKQFLFDFQFPDSFDGKLDVYMNMLGEMADNNMISKSAFNFLKSVIENLDDKKIRMLKKLSGKNVHYKKSIENLVKTHYGSLENEEKDAYVHALLALGGFSQEMLDTYVSEYLKREIQLYYESKMLKGDMKLSELRMLSLREIILELMEDSPFGDSPVSQEVYELLDQRSVFDSALQNVLNSPVGIFDQGDIKKNIRVLIELSEENIHLATAEKVFEKVMRDIVNGAAVDYLTDDFYSAISKNEYYHSMFIVSIKKWLLDEKSKIIPLTRADDAIRFMELAGESESSIRSRLLISVKLLINEQFDAPLQINDAHFHLKQSFSVLAHMSLSEIMNKLLGERSHFGVYFTDDVFNFLVSSLTFDSTFSIEKLSHGKLKNFCFPDPETLIKSKTIDAHLDVLSTMVFCNIYNEKSSIENMIKAVFDDSFNFDYTHLGYKQIQIHDRLLARVNKLIEIGKNENKPHLYQNLVQTTLEQCYKDYLEHKQSIPLVRIPSFVKMVSSLLTDVPAHRVLMSILNTLSDPKEVAEFKDYLINYNMLSLESKSRSPTQRLLRTALECRAAELSKNSTFKLK